MANIKKYRQKQVYSLIAHNERATDNPSNLNIDPARKHLNYKLSPERRVNFRMNNSGTRNISLADYDYLISRLKDVRVYNRSDVIYLCSWIIYQPDDLNPNESRKFFDAVYVFLADRYGNNNVVNATVHLDETTNHLHFLFTPIIQDKKKKGEKLCAKEVINRKELQKFHPELQEYLSLHEIKCSILTGAVTRRNRGFLAQKEYQRYKEEQRMEREREQQKGVYINDRTR